jgi:hypothetical protein
MRECASGVFRGAPNRQRNEESQALLEMIESPVKAALQKSFEHTALAPG